jgi:hypothetical protein
MRRLALSLACALAAGCARGPDSDPAPAEARTPVVSGGERVHLEIAWPDPTRHDPGALAALPEASQNAVARSPIPVLVPGRTDLLAVGTVIAREHFYAFSARTGDVSVAIQATRITHRYPSIPAAEGPATIRGSRAFVTQNEGVHHATWRENGVSYALDVECSRPFEGACADDAFLLDLAEHLAYVGGAGGAQ